MLIWGDKTIAMFDVWSIEHLVNGIAMAGAAAFIIKQMLKKIDMSPQTQKILSFFMVLTGALLWECAEHYIEAGILPGVIGARVTFWFQGVEHWSNRIIGDNLTVITGWFIYYRFIYNKKPNIALAAKIFTTIWMLVHIFVFPDSMYLQRLLFPN